VDLSSKSCNLITLSTDWFWLLHSFSNILGLTRVELPAYRSQGRRSTTEPPQPVAGTYSSNLSVVYNDILYSPTVTERTTVLKSGYFRWGLSMHFSMSNVTQWAKYTETKYNTFCIYYLYLHGWNLRANWVAV
jgi:hypothetical protein